MKKFLTDDPQMLECTV